MASSLSTVLTSKNLRVGATSSGGTTVSGGGLGFHFDTITDAASVSIPAIAAGGPTWLRTNGYYSVGDYGAALYTRVGSQPVGHTAWFQSVDGAYWELTCDGDLWVEMFGAREMINFAVRPADGAVDDSYFAFLAADHYITAKSLAGVNLRVGPGYFYISRAINLKRTPYNIKGFGIATTEAVSNSGRKGTVIRTHPLYDGIIVGYNYTAGHDYYVWQGGHGVEVGQAVWTSAGRLYRCTIAGVTDGLIEPTGTTNDVIDGTAHWNYEGTTLDKGDLDTGNTNAGSSRIEDLTIWSFFLIFNIGTDPVNNNPNSFCCGILMRARATIRNVFTYQFPGYGVGVLANAFGEILAHGNANGWQIYSLVSYFNAHDGLHVEGADANAGVAVSLDFSSNARWGLADWSFLGNNYFAVQTAFDGTSNTQKFTFKGVTHNGYRWLAKLPMIGILGFPNYLNEPGTDWNAWVKFSAGGQSPDFNAYPAWSATEVQWYGLTGPPYEPGGAYSGINANCRNVFNGMYVEGGTFPAQPARFDIVMGGLANNGGMELTRSGIVIADQGFLHPIQVTNSYSGVYQKSMVVQLGPSSGYGLTTDGTEDFNNVADSTVFYWQDYNFNVIRLSGRNLTAVGTSGGDFTSHLDWTMGNYFNMSGFDTGCKFGRATTQPNVMEIPALIVGNRQNFNQGTALFYSAGVPSSTPTPAAGEVAINSNAANGQPWGWQWRSGAWVSLGSPS